MPVAPGVLWLRLPLPFRLGHVNVYFVADGTGWAVIDTGAGDDRTCAIWTALLDAGTSGALCGKPITRVIATHHHPDHVGAAAFLCGRTGSPLLMGEIEYLTARSILDTAGQGPPVSAVAGWKRNGLTEDQRTLLAAHADRYRRIVPDLPDTFAPLRAGDRLAIGDRRFSVLEMPGHSSAQILLYEPDERLLFAADHVMTRISPNIGVSDRAPDDDTLGRYLASLERLRTMVPDGCLVLPGHHLPFRHLHARTRGLEAHHAERCLDIERATAGKGLTAAELVPILFPFQLDTHEFWFAFSETLAHLNFLARRERLEARESHGRRRWGAVARRSHAG